MAARRSLPIAILAALTMNQLLKTKDIDVLVEETHVEGKRLKRSLGPWSLIAFGIGAVIGGGIFTVTGTAAAGQHLSVPSILNAPLLDLILHGGSAASTIGRPGAGPGLTLSFILVAMTCGFAALCYAELASMIPIAGSAYTYAYTTLGEIFAWIIGWDLILEYAVSNMSVAVGFSAYFNVMCDYLFGAAPAAVSFRAGRSWRAGSREACFNLPSFLIVMLLSWILVRGVKESAGANNFMVVIKLAAVLLFVFGAARAVHSLQPSSLPAQWVPRRGERRGHRLLYVHRFRFGVYRRRRMPQSAKEHADRHHRNAGRRAAFSTRPLRLC